MLSLSVLITYHNEKELLTECLQSILSQSPPPLEILVYDDASDFPAAEYLPKSEIVRVVRGEKNLGPSRGRNILLKEAKGEYVHFHDSDDWFHPEWCRKIAGAIQNGADAIYTEVSSFRPEGKLAGEKIVNLRAFSDNRSLIRFCIRNYMLVPAGTFKRSLVNSVSGYREALWQSEDFDFNVRVALTLPKFVVLLEPLVNIRLRAESRSQNKIETNTCALQALLLLEKQVPAEYKKDLAEKASEIGAELFRLNAKAEAREAFEIAKRFGPASFLRERRLYRVIARLFGQESAECFGDLYRRALPGPLRRLVH